MRASRGVNDWTWLNSFASGRNWVTDCVPAAYAASRRVDAGERCRVLELKENFHRCQEESLH